MIVMVRMKAIDWILWERQKSYSVPQSDLKVTDQRGVQVTSHNNDL